MYTPKSGKENEAHAMRMSQAGNAANNDDLFNEPAPDPGPSRPKPENYLVQSILVTIFCCWPLGIPAIIQASRVNSRWAEGDYEGAEEASAKAKQFCWISFGLGLAGTVIYIIMMVASGELG